MLTFMFIGKKTVLFTVKHFFVKNFTKTIGVNGKPFHPCGFLTVGRGRIRG
jgi:hypothetical protein